VLLIPLPTDWLCSWCCRITRCAEASTVARYHDRKQQQHLDTEGRKCDQCQDPPAIHVPQRRGSIGVKVTPATERLVAVHHCHTVAAPHHAWHCSISDNRPLSSQEAIVFNIDDDDVLSSATYPPHVHARCKQACAGDAHTACCSLKVACVRGSPILAKSLCTVYRNPSTLSGAIYTTGSHSLCTVYKYTTYVWREPPPTVHLTVCGTLSQVSRAKRIAAVVGS
jgi:hypothetical protein